MRTLHGLHEALRVLHLLLSRLRASSQGRQSRRVLLTLLLHLPQHPAPSQRSSQTLGTL